MGLRCWLSSAGGQQKPSCLAVDCAQFHTIMTGMVLPEIPRRNQLCHAAFLWQGVCLACERLQPPERA